MTLNRLVTGLAAAGLALTATASVAQDYLAAPLVLGLYECKDQMNNVNPLTMFGLVDDSHYRNFDGELGTYAYDPATGIISVGLEKGAPARYLRISEVTFRFVNDDGSVGGFTCPLNRAKDPNNPPW